MSVIYQVKVKRHGMDGWGRDTPATVDTIGVFSERDDAVAKRNGYNAMESKGMDGVKAFDISNAWIDSQVVQ
jgi:hypothetical protein